MQNLCDRFEPKTGAAKVQLTPEFHELKLSSAEEEPFPWITSLEPKRRRLKTLGSIIEDDNLILHILNSLPKEHETVVELCEEDLSRDKVDFATVQERIRSRYNRLMKTNADMQDVMAKECPLLAVDEATSMKWSFFLSTKSAQVPLLIGFIKTLKDQGKQIKFISRENAGKHESLKKQVKHEGLNIKFECTARNTPQQNGKVERDFATFYGRIRSIMNGAKWDDKRMHMLWMEAAAMATKLDSIMNEREETSLHQKFYNENPAFEKYLKTNRSF